MELFKQFTDEQGVSQIVPIPENMIETLTKWAPAKAWRLHIHQPGTFLDWHPSDGKLLIIVLSGEIEIGTSDGKDFLCKPGMLRMTQDTGKGHTGRVSGSDPCVVLMVDITE
ncbi:hypothetical protein FACS1894110_04550 [Spirochaetia bacterium]|nr:hypothetical protein FACS1894110_04550 [Spirochaetia bacterium]